MSEKPEQSYSARPDGNKTITDMLTMPQLKRFENAVAKVLDDGWGSVTLIIDKGVVTLIEERTTERLDKLK